MTADRSAVLRLPKRPTDLAVKVIRVPRLADAHRLKEPLHFDDEAGGASGAVLRAVFCAGRDNLRDNNGDKRVPRKSRRRIYLGFSPR